jgi:hypothetical protein
MTGTRSRSRSSACSSNRSDRPEIPGTRICGPPQEKASRSPRSPRRGGRGRPGPKRRFLRIAPTPTPTPPQAQTRTRTATARRRSASMTTTSPWTPPARDEGEHEQHGEHDANFGPGADNDDADPDEATLFREIVGFSVIESCVNAVTELWREQRRDHANPHSVLRGKELTDLIEIVKSSDWDRRRAEYIDRALFTVVDGYDPPKMMAGIAWCWKPYLRAAADFLIGQCFHPSSS